MNIDRTQLATNVFAYLTFTTLLSAGVEWKLIGPGLETLLKAGSLLALLVLTARRRTGWPIRRVMPWAAIVLIASIVGFRAASQVVHMADFKLLRQTIEMGAILFILGDPAEWQGIADGFYRYAVFYVAACFVSLLISPVFATEAIWAKDRFGGLLGNAVNHATNSALLIPFAIEGAKRKRDAWLLAASLLFFILLSHSRTALGIAVMSLGIYWLRPWKKPFSFSFGQAVLVLAALLVGLALSSEVTSFLARGQSAADLASFTGRTKLWDSAMMIVGREPLFGEGSSARFLKLWVRFSHRYWETSGGAHNHFLGTAAMMGVPLAASLAVAVIVALFASLSRIWLRCSSLELLSRRRIMACCTASIAIVAMFGSDADYVYYPIGWIFWWTILSALVREAREAA